MSFNWNSAGQSRDAIHLSGLFVRPGDLGGTVAVLAGQSATIYCSIGIDKNVKRVYWVTPRGEKVMQTGDHKR